MLDGVIFMRDLFYLNVLKIVSIVKQNSLIINFIIRLFCGSSRTIFAKFCDCIILLNALFVGRFLFLQNVIFL